MSDVSTPTENHPGVFYDREEKVSYVPTHELRWRNKKLEQKWEIRRFQALPEAPKFFPIEYEWREVPEATEE